MRKNSAKDVTIVTKERVVSKNGSSEAYTVKFAQIISNNTNIKLPLIATLQVVKLTDDGIGNDLKARVGIYFFGKF